MDIVLRAIVLFAFVFVVVRVMGRRELAKLEPFDLILLIVLGDAIQQGLTQDDYSVTGALIAISTIAAVQSLTSYVSFRSPRFRKVVEGNPIVIVQGGKLIDRNLKRERMSADEVSEAMRQQQIATFAEVAWGIVEANGKISFIKKAD